MRVFSCESMRKIEEKAFDAGMDYLTMMENAGVGCAKKIIALNKKNGMAKEAVILCGKGKNAGDGFVIARKLCENGFNIRIVFVCGEPKSDEALYMLKKLESLPVLISDIKNNYNVCINAVMNTTMIIDCIFGIGFKGLLNDDIKDLIINVNSSDAMRIAVDIPSGLEGDSGKVNSVCFDADYTFAVTCLKPVHVLKPAVNFCGINFVIDIGFDNACYDIENGCEFLSFDKAAIRSMLPVRNQISNKGDFGKILLICGSKNMQGAAVISAKAAVNSGAGLVTCAFPDAAYCAIAPKLTEPLMLPVASDESGTFSKSALPEIIKAVKKSDAVLIGCGIGLNEETKDIVYNVIKEAECPIIIDADGINALALNINILKEAKAEVVITPHPGEMARLCGLTIEQIQSDRVNIARAFASKYSVSVVLKGANTVVAPKIGMAYVNRTGNSGMATGGSGDMLAGIILSFLGQKMSVWESCVAGVYIHGICADKLADRTSERGITPSSMIDFLPLLLSQFE